MNQRTESTNPAANREGGAQPAGRSFTTYQVHLLEKLERMRRNRREYAYRPDAETWILKAMDRAIYSTFLDCLNEGLADQAKSIVSSGPGVDASSRSEGR